MAKKKEETKHNPDLCTTILKDGRVSFYLEYYLGREQEPILDEYGEQVYYTSGAMKGKPKFKVTHKRRKETLNLYCVAKPRTTLEKQERDKVWNLAEAIQKEKEQEFKELKNGHRIEGPEMAFLDYFQDYLDNYDKKDKRNMQGVYNRFYAFLHDSKKYKYIADTLKPSQIDKAMVTEFVKFLPTYVKDGGKGKYKDYTPTGEGPLDYFRRFRKVINQAILEGLIKTNPCAGVKMGAMESAEKVVLTLDELDMLRYSHNKRENDNVKRAFLFTCNTGVRFCDVERLTYSNIEPDGVLKFKQVKTQDSSKHSTVTIPLTDEIKELIGPMPEDGNMEAKIFVLPTFDSCLRQIKHWAMQAGIDERKAKKLTWHSGRHTFGTILTEKNVNPIVTMGLMGHSTLKYTTRYTKPGTDVMKEALQAMAYKDPFDKLRKQAETLKDNFLGAIDKYLGSDDELRNQFDVAWLKMALIMDNASIKHKTNDSTNN